MNHTRALEIVDYMASVGVWLWVLGGVRGVCGVGGCYEKGGEYYYWGGGIARLTFNIVYRAL